MVTNLSSIPNKAKTPGDRRHFYFSDFHKVIDFIGQYGIIKSRYLTEIKKL
ncbi:hypothetical protein JCM16816_22550 [Thermoanaerobacter brockii subsp. lactiethylicus]|jgi:hypothetical protein|uniref:Uncharacterized protein n=2 Tax=Thermoanaerobacter TaxID=1754 RepID=I8QYI2_9THEO|nr:hypothetical protein Thebr_0132 [Thermoanaerobacter brockii subsp. finnii Ako-1]EGD50529.1 hypothetical protein TheetDRAFT_2660 [Thermoanaerobacter ethanolicus JW 200]EIW00128.1 hypothetical protein ThesiDRAFT1_1161 [Thermoanaerobacter siderophilus SR4]KUJ89866.1 MAG: hypothetical protein XD37_1926 [Thermoanaerobacter thermocopriae]